MWPGAQYLCAMLLRINSGSTEYSYEHMKRSLLKLDVPFKLVPYMLSTIMDQTINKVCYFHLFTEFSFLKLKYISVTW